MERQSVMARAASRSRAWRGMLLATLAVYGWATVQSCRNASDPPSFPDENGWIARLTPPAGRSMIRAADGRIASALEALNDRTLPSEQRLSDYRAELEVAERLLVRGIAADPADARALARLAALRWELAFPVAPSDRQTFVDMIRVAGSLAPRLPGVQLSAAKLLLKMGLLDEALPFLRRTVDLNANLAAEVVLALHDGGVPAEEIADRLPPVPSVLAALLPAYRREDALTRYLDRVESAPSWTPALVESFARACLLAGQPRRAEQRLSRLDAAAEPALESERQLQLALAAAATGRPQEAYEHAGRALALLPASVRHRELLGDLATASGDHEAAVSAYRETLGRLARASAPPIERARLYAKIGRAEQRRGRPDRAYDEYRRALELDPQQPLAAEALERIRLDAGLGGADGP